MASILFDSWTPLWQKIQINGPWLWYYLRRALSSGLHVTFKSCKIFTVRIEIYAFKIGETMVARFFGRCYLPCVNERTFWAGASVFGD
jgi:hypothetical protein